MAGVICTNNNPSHYSKCSSPVTPELTNLEIISQSFLSPEWDELCNGSMSDSVRGVSRSLINTVKEKVQVLIQGEPDCVSVPELERFKQRDELVVRFIHEHFPDFTSSLMTNPNMDTNMKRLCKLIFQTLKWKSARRTIEIKETDFPGEFFEMPFIHLCTEEFMFQDQRSILTSVNFSCWRKISPKWREKYFLFGLFILDKAVIGMYERGYDIHTIMDFSTFHIRDVDITLSMDFLGSVFYHYAEGIKKIYVINVPWIIMGAIKLVMKALPEKTKEKFSFVTLDSIAQEIGSKDLLPDIYGGKNRTIQSLGRPPNCLNLTDFCELHDFSKWETRAMIKSHQEATTKH